MSDPAITIENLSKSYRIGAAQPRYRTLRETLVESFRGGLRRLLRRTNSAREAQTFWALNDVSFAVPSGSIIGIIGRNGAGKSTLLKILSRVTTPTRGRIVMRGRVSSLLEVGTGFHSELTGRENVYLNGAVLGMTRREIQRKFDDILAFAELEKFIDTPVKRYSSGMQMRLAFAVAAHLEPEILIIDEVLAVGDARFQRKCIRKMQDVNQEGRTVLVVSHDMTAITRLCSRAILLDAGRLVLEGPAHQVIEAYSSSGQGNLAERVWSDPLRAPGNDVVRLRSVRMHTQDGVTSDAFDIRKPVGIQMEYEVLQPGHILCPSYHLHNEEGTLVFITADPNQQWRRQRRPMGRYVSTAWIPGNFLAEGRLSVHAALSTPEPFRLYFFERDAVGFHVIDSSEGDAARGDYAGPFEGVVRPLLSWETMQNSAEVPCQQ